MSRIGHSRARGRSLPSFTAILSAALLPLLLAACGTGTATPSGPSSSGSGLVSVAPPETASPAPSGAIQTASIAPASPTAPVGGSPSPRPSATISLTKLVGGLRQPIGASTAPGDPRLFVIAQTGQIVIVTNGKVAGTFLDISGRMSCCGERGLLGVAFHPDYAKNGRFFVRYTNPAGNLQISEFHVSSNADKADPASEKKLLTVAHPSFANHNGGRIEFGPDGYLYIGTGDGGSGGDPNNHGQDLNNLLGKMLRIDVNSTSGGLPYAIPTTNPFAGQSGKRGEIFAYGLRNPYTFSFDRSTGDLWIADVGQNRYEEVDRALASAGGGSGVNYGWSVMEANRCYKPTSDCIETGLTRPLAEYSHGSGDSIGCAIVGGYVYRGTAHPELDGLYLFGDYCTGRIWSVEAAGPATQTPHPLMSSGFRITGWAQDSAGELYVTGENGSLYQVIQEDGHA
jgi:glucose/arabinose dehydrogenase